MPGYAQTRKDFEFLESVVELDDWVTLMDEIEWFMQTPTKAFATKLYEGAISVWFSEQGLANGLEDMSGVPSQHRRRIRGIARRHYLD